MSSPNPDIQLLRRLSRGEKEAYEAIFARYYIKVHRFIRSIIHEKSTAEDLAQNVFMKIWSNRNMLTSVTSLDGYLYTVARNETYDYLRRQQSRAKYIITELQRANLIDDMHFNYDLERMEHTVAHCVNEMPSQRQMVYRMSREEQLSNAEIAERLNLSKRTVDRHLSLALHDIRVALAHLVSGFALFCYSNWV